MRNQTQLNTSTSSNGTKSSTKKNKFSHSTAKIIHFSTFFRQQKVHYLIQCQNWQYFGYTLIHKGFVKQKILCSAYNHKCQSLYMGTNKGAIIIAYFNSQKQQEKETERIQKISPVNGQPILCLFTYFNQKQSIPQIIAINSQGIFRKYANNRYLSSISLPFRVSKAIYNKCIINEKDIAMVIMKSTGKFPYCFSAQDLIKLCSAETTQPQINEFINQYEKCMDYFPDQQIITEQVTALALSNSQRLFAISTDQNLRIYTLKKRNQMIRLQPLVTIRVDSPVSNIDMVEHFIVYVCPKKGISTFDIENRKKASRNLIFKQTEFELVAWTTSKADQIVYGSMNGKAKMILCELKITERD